MIRRVAGVVIVGLALFLAAACGDNGGDGDGDGDGGTGAPSAPATSAPADGTVTTAEACALAEQLFNDLDGAGNEVRDDLFEAAESGDAATLQQAQTDYLDFVSDFTGQLRSLAGAVEDPAQRDAIETFATEFETVADQVAANPEDRDSVDTSALDAAVAQAAGHCQ